MVFLSLASSFFMVFCSSVRTGIRYLKVTSVELGQLCWIRALRAEKLASLTSAVVVCASYLMELVIRILKRPS